MGGATYIKTTLASLALDVRGLTVNGRHVIMGDQVPQALGQLFGEKIQSKDQIAKFLAQGDTAVVLYLVDNELVSVFDPNVTIFTPDDTLTIKNRLVAEGWIVPLLVVTKESSTLVAVRQELQVFDGIGGDYRTGVAVTIPHTGIGNVVVMFAAVRNANNAVIVLNDKGSIIRTAFPLQGNLLNWMYGLIKSNATQMYDVLNNWFTSRVSQLRSAVASLDECLQTVDKTKGAACDLIDLDNILTAHKLAGLADAWPMFLKQANTPYSRLDLMNILSEYATHFAADHEKLSLAAKAGDTMVEYGDLEFRPIWVYWDKSDHSHEKYLLRSGESA